MNFRDRYGWFDRILYRLAFRAGTAQHALADVEEMLYRDTLAESRDPVFITALPRSGTTILLKLLWQTGRFASQTYQDMPFVMCPMLWNRFSRGFAREDQPRERAHGDGLKVSGKSPEAFEEMIWKHFWKNHYREDRILPWRSSDGNAEFNEFFASHMRKVITVRQENGSRGIRYLSKNNLNIARLAAPPKPLREGVFLIPFRDPLQQAASMLRQHRRFLRIHDEDDFVRRYMEAIGHHEFGRGLRPVDFDDWLEDAPASDGLAFWVRYWIAAYRYVLEHAGDCAVLVSYARLTDQPETALPRLAEAVDIPGDLLVSQVEELHPPRTHSVERGELSDDLIDEARAVYERLDQRARI